MNLIPDHMPARRAELYEDLVGFVERQLTEYGVEKPGAQAIANAMADHLADYWGGERRVTAPSSALRVRA